MEEIWKDIENCNGNYQVSSFGRVKSIARDVIHAKNGIQKRVGKILKPSVCKKGYNKYGIVINNKRASVIGSRLVAKAFIPNPNNYPCVLHKIESFPCNDNVDNLWWGTNDDNVRDKMQKGRHKVLSGEAHPNFGKRGELHYNFGRKGALSPNFGKFGALSPSHKKILNKLTGEIYYGVREASIVNNMSLASLNKKLNGHRKNNTNLIYI